MMFGFNSFLWASTASESSSFKVFLLPFLMFMIHAWLPRSLLLSSCASGQAADVSALHFKDLSFSWRSLIISVHQIIKSSSVSAGLSLLWRSDCPHWLWPCWSPEVHQSGPFFYPNMISFYHGTRPWRQIKSWFYIHGSEPPANGTKPYSHNRTIKFWNY